MAKFKKLSKAYLELENKNLELNALLAAQTAKNGGTLYISNSALNFIKGKYFSIKITPDGFETILSDDKISS